MTQPGGATIVEGGDAGGFLPHVSVSVKAAPLSDIEIGKLPPVMLTVISCEALAVDTVPGTAKIKLDGETVTVGAAACPLARLAARQHTPAATISARTNRSQTLIAASLRGFPNAYTNFFCGAST
jgi:hypothetical protein